MNHKKNSLNNQGSSSLCVMVCFAAMTVAALLYVFLLLELDSFPLQGEEGKGGFLTGRALSDSFPF
jgi:hypothetical protein